MDELDRFRGFRRGVAPPSEEARERAAARLAYAAEAPAARNIRRYAAAAVATIAAATAAALFFSTPWNASRGFLERAQAALTPNAETVLHEKWEVTSTATDPACTATHGPEEIWIDQTPPHRYRALLDFPLPPDKLDPDAPCRSGPAYEFGGTFDTAPLGLVGGTHLSVLDPVMQLREAISAGTAHDEGQTQLDGRTVERIRIDPPAAPPDAECPVEPADVYVDPDTFIPVEMHESGGLIIVPADGPVICFRLVVRIVTFEYLPRTAANLALTDIRAQHPNPNGP